MRFSSALLFLVCSSAASMQIDVFYNDSISPPAKNEAYKFVAHNLDSAATLTNRLNQSMPNNVNDASRFMNKFSNTESGKQLMKQIVDAQQSIGLAFQYGVKEVPAVVINKQYIVYGTTDVEKALLMFREQIK